MENNYKNLKEKAYKVALKFKGSKLEQEIVYAKLEKQGFPENIAKEVALNMVIEKKNLNKEDFLDYKKIVLFTVAVWVLLSIITYILTGDAFKIFGILITIIPAAILGYLMSINE